MHHVFISMDPGIDDALALLIALKCKNIKIEGISASYGNAPLEDTFRNSRDILSMFDREDIKVYKGAKKPLVDQPHFPGDVHGKNGINELQIPSSKAPVEKKDSFDAIYSAAKRLKGELELVMLGPSTDFALLYLRYPDITKYIKKIYIMGGALLGGNRSPQAEFNIFADPVSSEMLFDSNIKIYMFPLDVTMSSFFTEEELKEIIKTDNKAGRFIGDLTTNIMDFYLTHTGKKYFYFHDGCPLIYLENPSLFKGYNCTVKVESYGKLTYGKTICDLDSDIKFAGKKNTKVFLQVKREEFFSFCKDKFSSY